MAEEFLHTSKRPQQLQRTCLHLILPFQPDHLWQIPLDREVRKAALANQIGSLLPDQITGGSSEQDIRIEGNAQVTVRSLPNL
jgi:hypothetical protein